jgi:hypothetical protein
MFLIDHIPLTSIVGLPLLFLSFFNRPKRCTSLA